jgi:hypothetical protein
LVSQLAGFFKNINPANSDDLLYLNELHETVIPQNRESTASLENSYLMTMEVSLQHTQYCDLSGFKHYV